MLASGRGGSCSRHLDVCIRPRLATAPARRSFVDLVLFLLEASKLPSLPSSKVSAPLAADNDRWRRRTAAPGEWQAWQSPDMPPLLN
jgi:hypothetical protein